MPIHPVADTSQADARARHALGIALQALDLAQRGREPSDMSNALAQVGRCHRVLGELDVARVRLEQSLIWAEMLPVPDAQVDLLCELAELACALADCAPDDEDPDPSRCDLADRLDSARDHAFAAARLAGHVTDAHWEVKALLRVSDVLERCGDHADAIAIQCRALTLMGLDHAAGAEAANASEAMGRPPTAWLM